MLKDRGVEFTYREYTKEPLDEAELREVLGQLGLGAKDVLRKRDAKAQGLTGDEPDDVLITAMAGNPSLLQRPIAVLGGRAVLGRPVENIEPLLV